MTSSGLQEGGNRECHLKSYIHYNSRQDKSDTQNTLKTALTTTQQRQLTLVAIRFSMCCKAFCKLIIIIIILYRNNPILDCSFFGFWMKKPSALKLNSTNFVKIAKTSSFKEKVFLSFGIQYLKLPNKCFRLISLAKRSFEKMNSSVSLEYQQNFLSTGLKAFEIVLWI